MLEHINRVKEEAQSLIAQANSQAELEALRIKYLGRKGEISEILSKMAEMDDNIRPQVGKAANILKQELTRLIDDKIKQVGSAAGSSEQSAFDTTLPGLRPALGKIHPLSQVSQEICDIFLGLGFKIVEGPEIETEYNNFQALNIPLDHPSRDSFDTFYLDSAGPQAKAGKLLLRSHTSPAQIRVMQKQRPPVAVVIPGKVFRPDATDASHSFMFHQIEGLFVGEGVSFAHLKGVLEVFAKELFGKDIKMRFRPHFFPFTEPSAEVDISCYMCKGAGCSVCGRKGWLEILGAGMVHPNVFKAVGYDPQKYTGFAFGMGVDRIAMLKYGIDDIRLFYENDLRFLKQF
jgi:phenylalanyl-tRNA synthetase alpha chain